MAEKLQWFRFFPQDFLGSRKVKAMTTEEVGYYIKLLCLEWEGGPLPTDIREMAILLGVSTRAMRKAWDGVAKCFIETDEGYINERLEKVRAEQLEFVEKKRIAGAKGATTRWGGHNTANSSANSTTNSSANGLPMAIRQEKERRPASPRARAKRPGSVATAGGQVTLPSIPASLPARTAEKLDSERRRLREQAAKEAEARATGPPGQDG